YQLPATHTINIGGFDAAYVQGFHPAEPPALTPPAPGDAVIPPLPPAYLAGTTGTARWSRASSVLLLPQIGLPAAVTLRLHAPAPTGTLEIWQNGRELLAVVPLTGAWQTTSVAIRASVASGILKPSDVVLELRTGPTRLADGREVGVLVDVITYRTTALPLLPYPAQLLIAALLGIGVGLLLHRHPPASAPLPHRWAWLRRVPIGAWLGLYALLFLLLYRWQPLYPYPLRGLPLAMLAVVWGAVLIRYAPQILAYRTALWLLRLAALGLGAGWAVVMWTAARQHVTLAEPSVEADFRVFATRTGDLSELFRADGFYHLGYPALLWLVQPFTHGNAFLAARVVALGSALLLFFAAYMLARRLLTSPHSPHIQTAPELSAGLVLLALCGSPLLVQSTLYVGSDMPFAALFTLTLMLLFAATAPTPHAPPAQPPSLPPLALLAAGLAAGATFLIRHPGLILLVWGMGYLLWVQWLQRDSQQADERAWQAWQAWLAPLGWFGLGWLIAAAPQLVVNTLATGQPLYSQQAKNIWLAVYGNTDWRNWGDVPNTIPLAELVLRDPVRFATNWLGNLAAFIGTGAEDQREFGRAVQLRLLAFPLNWLGVLGMAAGLLGWRRIGLPQRGLLLLTGLYVASVALAFLLPRFFLPLTGVYALAAVALLLTILHRTCGPTTSRLVRAVVLAGLLMLALVPRGVQLGTQAVLSQQPPAQVAMVRLIETIPPDTQIATLLAPANPLGKYSAIAHRTQPLPATLVGADPDTVQAALAALGTPYVLWDTSHATPPFAPEMVTLLGAAGELHLYQVAEQ
ncbi:MAG: hypothetical protein HC911_15400, partial [Chloroflexaceae bacterium]|nr:hypothetical protein [Chloroflexaceae bacterium]